MASTDEPCFVFVRFWPGFSEDFPYADFGSCSDEVIDDKLWKALRAELKRLKVSEQKIESLCGEEGYVGRFVLLAEFVGWIANISHHHVEHPGKGAPWLCNRLVCIGVTESSDEAEAVIKELAKQANLAARKHNCGICKGISRFASISCELSNPKFAYAACSLFDRGVQASARLTIERLRANGALDAVESHAASHIHVCDAFGHVWRASPDRPIWDKDSFELRFRGVVVRRVSGQAANIISVLNAFEELKWPRRIDDPLLGGRDSVRVNDTVRSLNDGLTRIRFKADGSGKGFGWEVAR